MNIPYLAIFYSSLCSYIHIHAHTCRYGIPNTYPRTCDFINTVLFMPLHVPLRLLDRRTPRLKSTAAARPDSERHSDCPAAATLTLRPVSQTSDFTESQAWRPGLAALGLGVARVCGPRQNHSNSLALIKKCSISMGIFGVSKKMLWPLSVILPEYIVLLCSIIYWPIRSFVLSGSCTFFRWPLIVPHVALICLQKKCQHQVQ